MPHISVVIPAYRSSGTLPELLERIEKTLTPLASSFEVVVVEDGSPDDTWSVLKTLKQGRAYLKIARLSKNSGQHNAILCGFSLAKGDIVVTMDDDLQNPPEDIPKLVEAVESGYDLAIGAYDSKKHSKGRNKGGEFIDSIQRRIFNLPSDFQLTSFRAARKSIIDNVVSMGTTFPYITSMLFSHTERYVNVPVKHMPRTVGKSNYTLKKAFRLALNLLLNYSSYPLYLVMALCLSAFAVATALAFMVLWQFFTTGALVGWPSTIVSISFFSGLTLLALVVQGFYLARLTHQLTRSGSTFTIGELQE